jgi:DNA-binding transcriptional LysR family regulator
LLTDAGHELQRLTDRIEAALLDCGQSLDMIAGRSSGRVSIGAVSTAKYFAPFAIAGFSQRFPRIKVTLTIGNREHIRDALRGYDLDIAVMGQPPADVEVEMRPLGKHPHIIVAAAGHRLAKRKLAAIDPTFGIGLAGASSALVPINGHDNFWRRALTAVLITTWSLRLGLHIGVRTRKRGDDPRYAALRSQYGMHARLRMWYLVQAQALVSIPMLLAISLALQSYRTNGA